MKKYDKDKNSNADSSTKDGTGTIQETNVKSEMYKIDLSGIPECEVPLYLRKYADDVESLLKSIEKTKIVVEEINKERGLKGASHGEFYYESDEPEDASWDEAMERYLELSKWIFYTDLSSCPKFEVNNYRIDWTERTVRFEVKNNKGVDRFRAMLMENSNPYGMCFCLEYIDCNNKALNAFRFSRAVLKHVVDFMDCSKPYLLMTEFVFSYESSMSKKTTL